jgi:potassium-transporting ATPase KdpC subunit
MRRQLVPAVMAVLVFTVLCGILYPLVVTGIGQLAFHDKADGSLIKRDGVVVGSELLGQNFTDPKYFSPRPSAAGASGYDGTSSGGSNLGPTNQAFLDTVTERITAYRQANDLPDGTPVPVDAVTASGSGLDPDISVANARLQTARVAQARGMDPAQVAALVDADTTDQTLGFLGERGVNVVKLNLALDAAAAS